MSTLDSSFEGFAPQVQVRTIEETRKALEAAEEADKYKGIKVPTPPPDVVLDEVLACAGDTLERTKYIRMWQHPEYRQVAPGESVAQVFLAQANPPPGSTVIDFGTGTGRGALMLALLGRVRVEMLDFADNCLDEDVRQALVTQKQALRFTVHDLNAQIPITAQYGYCTDVMEHIPEEEVDKVLQNILRSAQHVFFQIACEDDVCGALINEKLHLSVHPYSWWLKKLQELDCVVHWSEDFGSHCMFYVSAWTGGKDIVAHGVLNIAEEKLIENVKENLKAGWQEIQPHQTNDVEVMILGGGPSLGQFVREIHNNRRDGMKLVTLNGTYNWALEQGLKPSAQIVVDAREFNARFTRPVIDGCKYLIASQCHPSVLEGLPKDRTLLWHTTMDTIRDTVNAARELWFGIPGGSTVMLRAIPLLRLLGFRKFHIYGMDSCLVQEVHHTYSQVENDKAPIIPVTVGGRIFQCHPDHISQAQEFMDLIKFLGDEIDLEVYGDGLIAHILKTGASLFDNEVLT